MLFRPNARRGANWWWLAFAWCTVAWADGSFPSVPAPAVQAPRPIMLVLGPGWEGADTRDALSPIARFLSNRTGLPFSADSTRATPSRRDERNHFVLVFDLAHIAGYRALAHNYRPVLRDTMNTQYMLLVNRKNDWAFSPDDLRGRRVCARPVPHVDGVLALSVLDHPVRRPVIISSAREEESYERLVVGECEAAVVQRTLQQTVDPDFQRLRQIHMFPPLPGATFSVSPAIPMFLERQIVQALLSPEGQQVSATLRRATVEGRSFVAANADDYLALASDTHSYVWILAH